MYKSYLPNPPSRSDWKTITNPSTERLGLLSAKFEFTSGPGFSMRPQRSVFVLRRGIQIWVGADAAGRGDPGGGRCPCAGMQAARSKEDVFGRGPLFVRFFPGPAAARRA